LLVRMQCEGLEPALTAINAQIQACTKIRDISRAKQYLDDMFAGVLGPGVASPNIVTYNTLINVCAEKGEADSAEALLLHMISRGLEPNEVTYGTICKVFARQGNVPAVERIMKGVESTGMPLNEYFFGSLISACGATRPPDPDRASLALADMISRGLRPQSVRRALGTVVGRHRAAKLLERHGCQRQRWPEVPGARSIE